MDELLSTDKMENLTSIVSRAPMRISFAGGGSEIEPFRSMHGGAVINATISLYAYCILTETRTETFLIFNSQTGESYTCEISNFSEINLEDVPKSCRLAFAVATYFISNFKIKFIQGVKLTVYSEAPIGSGLGASSTMTVALVHNFSEYFNFSLEPYSLAKIAFQIERDFLGLAGGVQDHFCAAFGGFNFMEFGPDDHILVNPLRIKKETLNELESSLLLLSTKTARNSSELINKQITSMSKKSVIETLVRIANNAVEAKSALLKWNIDKFGELLDLGWRLKKSLSVEISNPSIDRIIRECKKTGSYGTKLLGAGGGGYVLTILDPEKHFKLFSQLKIEDRDVLRVRFTKYGSESWRVSR